MEDVLVFWLGPLDADGCAEPARQKRWWQKSTAFDEEVRARFAATYRDVVAGAHEDWLQSPRGRLAYVIVLDQFSRNMFRDTPEMYAADEQALRAAVQGLERSHDRQLAFHERGFAYMPFMHSEDIEMQKRSVKLFTQLRDQHSGALGERAQAQLDFAVKHHDIVARWGRFPHRNAILDRTSTADELHFLRQPGSSF